MSYDRLKLALLLAALFHLVFIPLGQYCPDKLINLGGNRLIFSTELDIFQQVEKWIYEGAFCAWIFTNNNSFFRGSRRTQDPLFTAKIM